MTGVQTCALPISADSGKPTETSTLPAVPSAIAPSAPGAAAPPAEPAKSSADATKVAKAAASKDTPSEAAKPSAPKPVDLGTVSLRIDPWGEVFVNGRSIGNSPPLKQHKLSPGKYKIEVKNGTLAPYVTNIEVKAKDDVVVKYRFQ